MPRCVRLRARPSGSITAASRSQPRNDLPSQSSDAPLKPGEYLARIRGSWQTKPPDSDSALHPQSRHYHHGLFKHTSGLIQLPTNLRRILGMTTASIKLYGDRPLIGDIRGPFNVALSMYIPDKQHGSFLESFRAAHFLSTNLLGSIPGTRDVYLQFFSGRVHGALGNFIYQISGNEPHSAIATRPFISLGFVPLQLSSSSTLTTQPLVEAPHVQFEVRGSIKTSLLAARPMLDQSFVKGSVETGPGDLLVRLTKTINDATQGKSFGSASEALTAIQQPLLNDVTTSLLGQILDFSSASCYIRSCKSPRWMHGFLLNPDGTSAQDHKDPVCLPHFEDASLTSLVSKRVGAVTSLAEPLPRAVSVSKWAFIDRKIGLRVTRVGLLGTSDSSPEANALLSRFEKVSKTVDSTGFPWVFDVARRFFHEIRLNNVTAVPGFHFDHSNKKWMRRLDFVEIFDAVEALRIVSQPASKSSLAMILTLLPYAPQKVKLVTTTAEEPAARITVALSIHKSETSPTPKSGDLGPTSSIGREMKWLTLSAYTTMQAVLASMQFDSFAQVPEYLSEALLRTLQISDRSAIIVDVLVTCKATTNPTQKAACRAAWEGASIVTSVNKRSHDTPGTTSRIESPRASSLTDPGKGPGIKPMREGSQLRSYSGMLERGQFNGPVGRHAGSGSIRVPHGSRSHVLGLRTGFSTYDLSLNFSPIAYREVSRLADNQIADKIRSFIDSATEYGTMLTHDFATRLRECIAPAEKVKLTLEERQQLPSGGMLTQYAVKTHAREAGKSFHSVTWHDMVLSSRPGSTPDVRVKIGIYWTANNLSIWPKPDVNLLQYLESARKSVLELAAPSLGDLMRRGRCQQWTDVAALTIANNEWLLPPMQRVSVRIGRVKKGGTLTEPAGFAEAERRADRTVTLKEQHGLNAETSTGVSLGEEGGKQEVQDAVETGCDQAQIATNDTIAYSASLLESCRLTEYPTGEILFLMTRHLQLAELISKTGMTQCQFLVGCSQPITGASRNSTEDLIASLLGLFRNTPGAGMHWLVSIMSQSYKVFPGLSYFALNLLERGSSSMTKLSSLFPAARVYMRSFASQGPALSLEMIIILQDAQIAVRNGMLDLEVRLYGLPKTVDLEMNQDMADALSPGVERIHDESRDMLASADCYGDLRPSTEAVASRLADLGPLPFMATLEHVQVKLTPHTPQPQPVYTATVTRGYNARSGVYLALGSNVGNRLGAIEMACNMIDADPHMKVVGTSLLYETEPMYVEDQDRFLNGVCEIATALDPIELLNRLQEIESRLGRVRTVEKGPRSLDLDILLYRQIKMREERLVVPHALMQEREFVLRPLADIQAGFLFPHGEPVSSLLSKVAGRGPPMFPQTPLGPPGEVVTTQNPKRKTRVMSILNTTPDSFSDGGSNPVTDTDALRELIAAQIADGATIIDVGGQSSRPNAPDITAEEETARVLPAIEAFMSLPEETRSGVAISIDTYRAAVAEAGIKAGAHVINDISAGTLDPQMLPTVARLGCTYVMMHMRGTPATMQDDDKTNYEATGGLVESVATELRARIEAAQEAGVRRWRMILDPGIGFAKTPDQNLELLRRMPELIDHRKVRGLPWLVGSSRKGFIGKVTGVAEAKERTWGTAATVTAAVQGGADIVRVHDVKEMAQVVKMADGMYRF